MKNKLLRIIFYVISFFMLFGLFIALVRIGPRVSQEEAVVTERLYQFAKSESVSIAAAKLADGAWDKICVIDRLSGFDPLQFLNPPPNHMTWNKFVYWDWAALRGEMWGLVLISPSGEMLVVKVGAYALAGFSLYSGSRSACYEYESITIRKVIKNGRSITLHFESDDN